jgi:L-asparaginase
VIGLISLGGTIASRHSASGGAAPALDANELLDLVPWARQLEPIRITALQKSASTDLVLDDVLTLCSVIDAQSAEGIAGFVVTQGTDTLEDTAFLLSILIDKPVPVALTGALRTADDVGPDGPANLGAALRVASHAAAASLGVVVVINDEIHAAQFVHKAHTSKPSAFSSPTAGPVGFVVEDRVILLTRPLMKCKIVRSPELLQTATGVRVAHLALGFDDDGGLLDCARDRSYAGVVIQALGGGHVPARLVDAIEELSRLVPVVLSSRTGAGSILRSTYSYAGSETDLLRRGVISAGTLDSHKARLLLRLVLASGASRTEVSDVFAVYGGGG